MTDAPLLAIVGPTASGKTVWALALARKENAEIISVDSRQVYRGLSVGTAKPSGAWTHSGYRVDGIAYHLLDFLDPSEIFSAARFVEEASAKILDIERRGKAVILAGGTGLYFNALAEGLTPLPPRNEALRERLRQEAGARGREFLHRRLAKIDGEAAAGIPINNIARVIRALEVFELTGKPLSVWHREHRARPAQSSGGAAAQKRRFTFIGLDPGPEELNRRIESRCRQMLANGMIEETRALLERGGSEECPALSALGYSRVIACLKGRLSQENLLALLIQDTRQYAKRQRTWFRHQLEVQWQTP